MKKLLSAIVCILLLAPFAAAQERDFYAEAEDHYYAGRFADAIRIALEGVAQPGVDEEAAVELYSILGLDRLECTVAMLKNVPSRKMGRKDIIKIDEIIDIDFDVLGYVDPGITVNIVRDGKLDRKFSVELPERVTNVIRCRHPRCITSTEQELPHIFKLTDRENRVYRCLYCESRAKGAS